MPETMTSHAHTPDRINDAGLLTLDEAATFLRVSRPTVEALVDAGELPDVRLGKRSRRVPRQAVLDFICRRTTNRDPAP